MDGLAQLALRSLLWFGGFYAFLAGITLWSFNRKVRAPSRRSLAFARVCLVWAVFLVLTIAMVLLPVAFHKLEADLALLVWAVLMIVIGWRLQDWLRGLEQEERLEKTGQVR